MTFPVDVFHDVLPSLFGQFRIRKLIDLNHAPHVIVELRADFHGLIRKKISKIFGV